MHEIKECTDWKKVDVDAHRAVYLGKALDDSVWIKFKVHGLPDKDLVISEQSANALGALLASYFGYNIVTDEAMDALALASNFCNKLTALNEASAEYNERKRIYPA